MVTVEALLAPAVVSQVSRKLTDYTLDEVKLLCNFGFDLEFTKETLLHLDEHLRNLENSSFRSERKDIQHWLSKTKLLAYDIEDIVDEYYSSKEQFDGSSCGDKGLMLCTMSNPMLLKVCTAHKMKSKRDKLQRRQQLATQHHVISNSSVNFEEKQTTSYTNDKIIGRDGDLENIMSMLMRKNVEKISIIPIVGPVGFGKTSLARHIFKVCETKFKSCIWVYVSMGTINLKIIGKAIIEQSGGCTNESMQLEVITRNVQCILNDNGHSCLIVLDNLWGKDEQVDELKKMLMTGSHTTSKIIVTTPSERVAELMSTVPPYKLAALSDSDCSTIFSQTADVGHNDPLFREYGEEIIRKCGGIPLVAKFLGFVVNTQRQMREVWLAARDKEMWKIEEDYPEGKILSVFTSLKLIYYKMPHALRLCFVYCSIFPKGSAIDKKKLVQQWIAHDMVDSKHGVMPPNVIAEMYIDDLKAISFLQVLERNTITAESSSAPGEVLYMHNLAYELARSIANKDILVCLADEKKRDTRYCDYRYAQLSTANLQLINQKDWPWKLRSLILKTSGPELEHLIHVLSVNKYLRVLDLSGCSINELPDPIFQLKQLRYLNASNLPITTLPPQMSSLQKLRTFDLSGTELEVLPSFVRSLKMLNYLNLHGCHKLRDLTSLDMLHELQYLNLSCCPALGALPASLEKLTKLRFLNLSNCSKLQISPSGLLQSFVGFTHLEDLNLSGFEMQMLPDFLGSFYSLHFLNLSKCSMLSQLPQSFCELVNLKDLNLSFCSDLKVLHESFERLRSLQFLNLSSCSSLQYLPSSFGKLKNLKDLNLSKCSSLQYLPPSFHELENLKDLNLSYCCKLEALDESFGHLCSLQFLNLSNHSRLQYLPPSFGKLENLKGLNLSYCYSLQYLPPSFCELANLKNLNLSFCTMLNVLHESFGCLRSLQFLNLSNCSLLQDLPESLINLSSLEDLNLSQCSGLKEFPRSLANHKKIRITVTPTYQDCINLAGELHEETNLQISQLHRSLEQVVTDVTRGANDLDIVEKKNVQDRMKAPMTPSSPSEKDRAEEPKDITKASSTSEASSSTPFPGTSLSDISTFGSLLCNGEITDTRGETGLSGAFFQSGVDEWEEEAELKSLPRHQSYAQSRLVDYTGSSSDEILEVTPAQPMIKGKKIYISDRSSLAETTT